MTNRRKKLLLICPYQFYPPDSGGGVLVFNNCFLLSKHFDLTVLYPTFSSPDNKRDHLPERPLPWRDIPINMTLLQKTKQKKLSLFTRLLHVFSLQLIFDYLDEFYENPLVQQHIHDDYSIIQLEQSFWYHPTLKKRKGKLIINQHNHEFRYWLEMAGSHFTQGAMLKAARHFWESWKILSKEKDSLREADLVLALSNKESQIFRQLVACAEKENKIHTIPGGILFPTYNSREKAEGEDEVVLQDGGIRIVYVAALYLPRAADGAIYFIQKILPLIKRENVRLELYLIGRNPIVCLQKICAGRNDIILTGYVKDPRKYIEKAHIYIVPVRYRSGISFKIMEAMSLGKAVIATSWAAAGLNIEAGTIILADNPVAFARAVVELARDKDKRRQLEHRSRRYAESHFNAETIFHQETLPLYQKLLCGKTDVPFNG